MWLQAAKLPIEIEEKSYTVLDTSEGAIMLHVNHGGEGVSPNRSGFTLPGMNSFLGVGR